MVSAQRLRIDAAREGRKSQQAEPQPPHQSQLNEAARTELPVSADLEIEARLILANGPAEGVLASVEGDYTLAESFSQAKTGEIAQDLC